MTTLSHACIWIEGVSIEGEYRQFEETPSSLYILINIRTDKKSMFSERFEEVDKNTTVYHAVKSIVEGHTHQAIEILLQKEKERPNLYETASNLGTAYELDGNYNEALKYIGKALAINPQSHHGTEWLHFFILKSKIELQENSELFSNSRLLPLPKTFKESSSIEIDGVKRTIKDLRKALIYQLKERVIFVKPKDKIVAELLYTLGKIEAQIRVLDEAKQLFELSTLYGFVQAKLIEDELKKFQKIEEDKKARDLEGFGVKLILFLILLIPINYLLKRRKAKLNITPKALGAFHISIIIIANLLIYNLVGIILFQLLIDLLHIKLIVATFLFPIYVVIISSLIFHSLNHYIKRPLIALEKNRKKIIIYTMLLFFIIGFFIIKLFWDLFAISYLSIFYLLLFATLFYIKLKKYFATSI